jgi:outer membrane protein assembly factor BamD (BamD/ComL family)
MRTSNTFWVILLIVGIGIMVVFFYSDVNPDAGDFYLMPILALTLAVPFAVAFTVLMTRLVANIFVALIYGERREPEKELYGKARKLIVERQFSEAIKEFSKILEGKPDDEYSRLQIAEIYAEHLKNYSKAIEEYKKLIEMKIDENSAISALSRLADLYGDHLNEPRAAAEMLEEIVRRYPDSPNANRARKRLKSYKI